MHSNSSGADSQIITTKQKIK